MRDAHASVLAIDLDRQLGVDGFAKAFDAATGTSRIVDFRKPASRSWRSRSARFSNDARTPAERSSCSTATTRSGAESSARRGGSAWRSAKKASAPRTRTSNVPRNVSPANGVLLALASKNDESAVWEVFDRHGSMVLRRDDFVAFKINWNDKTVSLRELADELDVGLDAFVFWDDSPFERAMVRAALPAVEVVDVPDDVTRWPQLLANLESLQAFSYTTEDRKKTEQYKRARQFSRDRGRAPRRG